MTNLSAPRGGYALGSYPDCETFHHGKYEGLTVYVVGRFTDQERLFSRTQLHEASVYQRETGLNIEAIATAELCDDAVLAVYQPA